MTLIQIPLSLLGAMATLGAALLSIVVRWKIQKNTENIGSDLNFCAVGLRLGLVYRRIDDLSISPLAPTVNQVNPLLLGQDVVFLIFLLIGWILCLHFIQRGQEAQSKLLGKLNPNLLTATIIGCLAVAYEMMERL